MNLRKLDRFTPFAAGLAIGVTATLLLVPEGGGNTRNHIRNAARRVGDGLKAHAEKLGRGAVGIPSEEMSAGIENGGRRKTMTQSLVCQVCRDGAPRSRFPPVQQPGLPEPRDRLHN